ncbi:MAG: ATP-dependent nuclease [Candidatus Baldrarchaeia archaeon]
MDNVEKVCKGWEDRRMYIERIEVENFRGIRKTSIDGLRQLTILIGRNGAGKSSLLEALYLVSSCASIRDDIRGEIKLDYLISRRGGRGDWNTSRDVLWYQMDTSQDIVIRLHVSGRPLEFHIFDRNISLSAPHLEFPVCLLTEEGFIELSNGYLISKSGTSYTRHEDLLGKYSDVKKLLENVLFIDHKLLSKPSLIEGYAWAKVASKRLDKEIVSMIRDEFEMEAEGLTFLPIGKTYLLALQTSKTTVRIDDLGDGARIAILISLLLLASNPTLVLIEEPENHMHPAGLKSLTSFILKLAKSRSFQLLVSTHSVEFVSIAKEVAENLGIEASVIYLERNSEGIVAPRSFSLEDAELLRKLGIDIRLLYVF